MWKQSLHFYFAYFLPEGQLCQACCDLDLCGSERVRCNTLLTYVFICATWFFLNYCSMSILSLRNKLHRPMHCKYVYNGHGFYTCVVITWQSNPPISQFISPCNECMSVWSMFPCNTVEKRYGLMDTQTYCTAFVTHIESFCNSTTSMNKMCQTLVWYSKTEWEIC